MTHRSTASCISSALRLTCQHEHDSGDPDDDREPQGPASPLNPRHLGHPPPDAGTRTFTWPPASQHNPPSRVPLRKKPPPSSTRSTRAPRRFPRSSGRSPSEPQEGRLTIQPGAGGRAEQGSATDCSSVEQRGASVPIQVAERSLSSSARFSKEEDARKRDGATRAPGEEWASEGGRRERRPRPIAQLVDPDSARFAGRRHCAQDGALAAATVSCGRQRRLLLLLRLSRRCAVPIPQSRFEFALRPAQLSLRELSDLGGVSTCPLFSGFRVSGLCRTVGRYADISLFWSCAMNADGAWGG